MPNFTCYCDSNSPNSPGTGTSLDPYRALASIPWSTVATAISGSFTATINLNPNSIFRETLQPTCAGGVGNRIVIQRNPAIGSGANPRITGLDKKTGWTSYGSGAGSTWQVALSSSATFVVLRNGINCQSANIVGTGGPTWQN